LLSGFLTKMRSAVATVTLSMGFGQELPKGAYGLVSVMLAAASGQVPADLLTMDVTAVILHHQDS
jgi:hypothetical protein